MRTVTLPLAAATDVPWLSSCAKPLNQMSRSSKVATISTGNSDTRSKSRIISEPEDLRSTEPASSLSVSDRLSSVVSGPEAPRSADIVPTRLVTSSNASREAWSLLISENVTITPVDTCGLVRLSGERYRAVRECQTPVVRALMENYRCWADWRKFNLDPEMCSSILFDTVAVYLAYAEDNYFERLLVDVAVGEPGDG